MEKIILIFVCMCITFVCEFFIAFLFLFLIKKIDEYF